MRNEACPPYRAAHSEFGAMGKLSGRSYESGLGQRVAVRTRAGTSRPAWYSRLRGRWPGRPSSSGATSAAARSPERTAPSMYPMKTSEVSVPAQWIRPTGARSAAP
jgi:hypothetical protein